MARATQAVEVNKFNAGLITDAGPLTTPDNSSLDEDNMVLNIDGSRNRRLGMDYEDDYEIISTSIVDDGNRFATSSYRWDNAGGDPEKSIQVVQLGNQLKFFHTDGVSLSAGLFHTETFSSDKDKQFSLATVDGILVVVNGDKDVYYLEYDEPNTITATSKRLLIRDLFGVADVYSGVDITRNTDVQNRPASITDAHTYNLRNQSFGIPRLTVTEIVDEVSVEGIIEDPIVSFKNADGSYPANSDSVVEALYPDTTNETGRTVDRFHASDLSANPLGTSRAALGYFIIDALDRGASRISENTKNMTRYPELSIDISTLPVDSSTNGPTAAAEFAGRVWYGGFSGEVIGPDANSPKLSSYVLFSKVVDNILDTNLCYQEGDPTAKDNSEIVDTDGGFIRINGAYGIKSLINLGGSLMVVAANGIWRIVGGDNGFTATTYIVEKISDRGCTSPNSIVIIENTFMFWSDDGIYHVAPNQYGDIASNNISFGRVQRFYDSITISNKRNVVGSYDSYERKVRWVFNNILFENTETRELVLDVQLQAYYLNTIKEINSNLTHRVMMSYVGLPYTIDTNLIDVLVDTDEVLSDIDEVYISSSVISDVQQKEIGYVVVTSTSPTISYTFARYKDEGFRDWRSVDDEGVDADAYVITSYMSGSDFQRDKGVNYITVHLRRTESGYDEDMNPLTPSSCLLQARWGWANGDNSGKWGREFQAYRYRINHFPVDENDTYDTGFSVISSRNKLRGNGKVISLKFRTEPDKNLHLYGWSMLFNVSENV